MGYVQKRIMCGAYLVEPETEELPDEVKSALLSSDWKVM